MHKSIITKNIGKSLIFICYLMLLSACATSDKSTEEDIETITLNSEDSLPFFTTLMMDVTRAKCLENGKDSDFKQCIDLLSFRPTNNSIQTESYKRKKQLRDNIIDEIAWKHSLSQEEMELFKSLFTHLYSKVTFEPEVEVISSGQYFDDGTDYHHLDSEQIIVLEKGKTFGSVLQVSNKARLPQNQRYQTSPLKVRWTLPGINYDSPEPIFVDEFVIITYSDATTSLMFNLATDNEMVEGNWKLEVHTIEGKKLFETSFKTITGVYS